MGNEKLTPINKINLNGKTIKKVFFAHISGGDKMYIVFTDATVLVMPVHRTCPVQAGRFEDFLEDREEVVNQMRVEMQVFCTEHQKIIDFLTKEVDNGLDGKQSG